MTEIDDRELRQRLSALRVDPPGQAAFESVLSDRLSSADARGRVLRGPWPRRRAASVVTAAALLVAGVAAALDGRLVQWVATHAPAWNAPERPPSAPSAPAPPPALTEPREPARPAPTSLPLSVPEAPPPATPELAEVPGLRAPAASAPELRGPQPSSEPLLRPPRPALDARSLSGAPHGGERRIEVPRLELDVPSPASPRPDGETRRDDRSGAQPPRLLPIEPRPDAIERPREPGEVDRGRRGAVRRDRYAPPRDRSLPGSRERVGRDRELHLERVRRERLER